MLGAGPVRPERARGPVAARRGLGEAREAGALHGGLGGRVGLERHVDQHRLDRDSRKRRLADQVVEVRPVREGRALLHLVLAEARPVHAHLGGAHAAQVLDPDGEVGQPLRTQRAGAEGGQAVLGGVAR